MSDATAAPKVFISYSWDHEDHKAWAKSLATRLRSDGIDVMLDQWEAVPGDQLPQFMERAIRENSYVLIICTENYKVKADGRKGGVGYEGDIMTAEVFATGNHRKFIPILRRGTKLTSLPTWLAGKYFIDLSADPLNEAGYADLVTTVRNIREQAPPLGTYKPATSAPSPPARPSSLTTAPPKSPESDEFEPIKIVGIIADEVGVPTHDGSQGSALYAVPFKFSRSAPLQWCAALLRNWQNPPAFRTMHRPGIASVATDRITLTKTTIEEVRDHHRETLILAVDKTNKEYAEQFKRAAEERKYAAEHKHEHSQRIQQEAKDIKFD